MTYSIPLRPRKYKLEKLTFNGVSFFLGSLASGCTETSGNDSAEDERSPRVEAACIITDTFLADDSSDDDSESVKISVKRQHRILRRKRRKLDRAKEKAWQAQEKRRHKKKEKLIKVCTLYVLK